MQDYCEEKRRERGGNRPHQDHLMTLLLLSPNERTSGRPTNFPWGYEMGGCEKLQRHAVRKKSHTNCHLVS
ncbi:hypothetical protein SeMB42_g05258 [Synchytrium endobioticum]|uniref:Uncharacterized protein n=1 Tax=Synchytrium endobioticum TaxID=286115 RepID=A0A507CSW2_9FUNG|nr:hypothetical protein SeMB42_g05258 [Synchytrium endobioticum]